LRRKAQASAGAGRGNGCLAQAHLAQVHLVIACPAAILQIVVYCQTYLQAPFLIQASYAGPHFAVFVLYSNTKLPQTCRTLLFPSPSISRIFLLSRLHQRPNQPNRNNPLRFQTLLVRLPRHMREHYRPLWVVGEAVEGWWSVRWRALARSCNCRHSASGREVVGEVPTASVPAIAY